MINLIQYKSTHQFIPYLSPQKALECRDFCRELVLNSKRDYFPLSYGSPNFLKVINNDPRSVVLGNYSQYNFFPWNENSKYIFDLLDTFIQDFLIINFKNLDDLKLKKFLLEKDLRFNDNFFVRVAYQKFENIFGYLDIHRDPASTYQIGAPILSLNSIDEIKRGGLYYIKNDKFYDVQNEFNLGEIIVFNSSWLHGVSNCHLVSDSNLEHLLIVVHAFQGSNFNKLSTK